jgi:hypothetical protein
MHGPLATRRTQTRLVLTHHPGGDVDVGVALALAWPKQTNVAASMIIASTSFMRQLRVCWVDRELRRSVSPKERRTSEAVPSNCMWPCFNASLISASLHGTTQPWHRQDSPAYCPPLCNLYCLNKTRQSTARWRVARDRGVRVSTNLHARLRRKVRRAAAIAAPSVLCPFDAIRSLSPAG